MKSEIRKALPEVQKPEYPCLRIYRDRSFVVLFTNSVSGTVVYSTYDEHKVGHYSIHWLTDQFVSFNDILELSNL